MSRWLVLGASPVARAAKGRDVIGRWGLDSGQMGVLLGCLCREAGPGQAIEARSSNGHRSIWAGVHYPKRDLVSSMICARRLIRETRSVEVGLSYWTRRASWSLVDAPSGVVRGEACGDFGLARGREDV